MTAKKRTTLLMAALAIAVVLSLPWARFQEPTYVPESGGDYQGYIPALGEVRMELSEPNDSPWLHLECVKPSKAHEWFMSGTNQARGILFSDDSEERPLRVELEMGSGQVSGIIQFTNGVRSAFKLPLLSESLGYERRSGFSVGDRGYSFDFHGMIPAFGTNEFEQAVTDWLKNDLLQREKSYRDAQAPDLKEKWEAWRTESHSWQWYSKIKWRVIFRNANTISLRCDDEHDTGGIHPNTTIETANFQWSNGALHQIRLHQYFRAGTGWEAALTEKLISDLKVQGASWPDESYVQSAIGWGNFTVDGTGLTFYFSPYQVGSYAEGDYVSQIPWSQLMPYLAHPPTRRGIGDVQSPMSEVQRSK